MKQKEVITLVLSDKQFDMLNKALYEFKLSAQEIGKYDEMVIAEDLIRMVLDEMCTTKNK
jgi:hypothetical protein